MSRRAFSSSSARPRRGIAEGPPASRSLAHLSGDALFLHGVTGDGSAAGDGSGGAAGDGRALPPPADGGGAAAADGGDARGAAAAAAATSYLGVSSLGISRVQSLENARCGGGPLPASVGARAACAAGVDPLSPAAPASAARPAPRCARTCGGALARDRRAGRG